MEQWKIDVENWRFKDNYTWGYIADLLIEKYFPELTYQKSLDKARAYIRSLKEYKNRAKAVAEETITDVKSLLLERLKKSDVFKDNFIQSNGISARVFDANIEDLKEQGYQIDIFNGVYKIRKMLTDEGQQNYHSEVWKGNKIIRFGLMGDTQINSNYTQLTYLHKLYDLYKAEGIETVYHTGDIDEGEEMRQGHKYECYLQGADAHVEEICRVYPKRDGIITKFITGNHDASIIRHAGYDIGHGIQAKRSDMLYLGQSSAIVNLTPNCTLELRHPLDGTAYAISYKMQKMAEAISGGEKPNILAVGHYHKAEYLFYRNIHIFQTGCFQAQSSWMKGKGISAHLGGWIVEIAVNDEGTIESIKPQFIPFYTGIKDDWKNWSVIHNAT
jgi:hypothetical protein